MMMMTMIDMQIFYSTRRRVECTVLELYHATHSELQTAFLRPRQQLNHCQRLRSCRKVWIFCSFLLSFFLFCGYSCLRIVVKTPACPS